MMNMLLDNIRVVDLTMWWSGPLLTQVLADMGAEVIKIEAVQRLDGWRGAFNVPGEKVWELSPIFNGVNRNKLGVTLDLTRPRGVEIFKRLVGISDVVADNYTPRVMKNFGLEYEVLREINPEIIMIELPAFGKTGPLSDYAGFADTLEQMAGLAQLTGYPDGPPSFTARSLTDPIAGLYGAFAVLTALRHRGQTGKGQYIELSQLEAGISVIGEAVVDYTVNQRVPPRLGNGHRSIAPHGCYRCKGEDKWVTIAVSNDEEWDRFCRAIGSPAWTGDDRFSDALSRFKNQTELDRLIEEWTLHYTADEVTQIVQKAGIVAAPVLNAADTSADPHLRERGFFQSVTHPVAGTHPLPGMPIQFSKTPSTIRTAAPCLGEHNEYVFGDLLGMTEEEMHELAADNIIGTAPLGWQAQKM